APEGEKTASLWCPTGLGLQRTGSKVKKAVPVRMPDWPEEELPSTKQVEVYQLFWQHQQDCLHPIRASDSYRNHFGWIRKSWTSVLTRQNVIALIVSIVDCLFED